MIQEQSLSPLENLRQLHSNIMQDIVTLDSLNSQLKDKTQRHFLKTFLKIMDRMSNQLIQLQNKFANIDVQVQKDEKCVRLAKQLVFFRDECVYLKSQLRNTEQKLSAQVQENKKLIKQKQALNEILLKKSKQAFKYKSRALSLTRHQSSSLLHDNLSKQKSEDKQSEYNPQKVSNTTRMKFMSCIRIHQKSAIKNNQNGNFQAMQQRKLSWTKQKRFYTNKRIQLNRTHLEKSSNSVKIW